MISMSYENEIVRFGTFYEFISFIFTDFSNGEVVIQLRGEVFRPCLY